MSASLVRKSLLLVDPPTNKNIKKKVPKSTEKKQTVTDIRKRAKSKEEILKENLKKLELIRNASKVALEKETVRQIIERGVTKRPVRKIKKKNKSKKQKSTAFTEEDFKKFEKEYFG